MGNNHQLMKNWSVKMIQSMDDPHFGHIDIYKNLQGQFIMSSRRTFVRNGDDRRINQLKQFLEYAKTDKYDLQGNDPQCNIVTPVLHQQNNIENNLCIVYEIVDVYCEYFNFTLLDMVKHKKQMDVDQLWHCFKWMLELGSLLLDKSWQLENGINLDNIFLTLKGKPIIYIHHLSKLNNTDVVAKKQQGMITQQKSRQLQLLQEIALCTLCLVCNVDISKNQNMQLYFRKCEKIDSKLANFLVEILRATKKSSDLTIKYILKTVQQFQENKEIVIAKQIRLNKFKYILPKPQVKFKTELEEKDNSNYSQHQSSTKKYNQRQVKITSLHGRRNTSAKNLTQKKSTPTDSQVSVKSNIMNQILNHNLRELLEHKNNKENNFESIKNSTLTQQLSGFNFKQQIENKKKMIQSQRQKINQRKQMIMGTGISASKVQNKQNIGRNNIKQLKDIKNSYRSKGSWSRRINRKQDNRVQFQGKYKK